MDTNPITAIEVMDQIKSWTELAAGVWLIFRLLSWIKNLQDGIEGLHKELVEQTSAIVLELRELRADWRAFYGAPPPSAPPVLHRRINGQ